MRRPCWAARPLRSAGLDVHGIAHITGGGLPGNVPRVLPDGLAARLDPGRWRMPSVMRLFGALGGLDDEELRATFNGGLGMVMVVPPAAAATVIGAVGEHEIEAMVVGEVTDACFDRRTLCRRSAGDGRVTTPDATGELRATVEIDYGQWYLFDPEADTTWLQDLVGTDPVGWAELEERRCRSSGSGAIVYALKHDGPTEIVVRSVASAPDVDTAADHVAECSLQVPSNRLAVSGWETTVIGGVLAVPAEPVRARIAWFGLTTGDKSAERFSVTIFPGPLGPVEVLRCWPAWEPPPRESTTPSGLRRYVGVGAAEARGSMEPLPLSFWSPYPQTSDGYVTSLWRDLADGSR